MERSYHAAERTFFYGSALWGYLLAASLTVLYIAQQAIMAGASLLLPLTVTHLAYPCFIIIASCTAAGGEVGPELEAALVQPLCHYTTRTVSTGFWAFWFPA